MEPVCCSTSSSNCCFLTCIQISLEAVQLVWYSHLFQNFPQFIVIHTVKGFGIVNKAEIDVFLELSFFFDYPVDVGNLISGSSAFSKTSYFGNYYINFLLVLSIFVYKMFAFLLSVSIWGIIMCSRASLVAQRLKHLPPMRETQVQSLGREDPLEKEMVTHSSILAWRIPWTEEHGRLQSLGSQRAGHN